MLPFLDTERKRRINLGGNTRQSSASDILDSVRIQREQRQEQKRRHEAAIRIQAWWRGRTHAAVARREMRRVFEHDVLGITGLRCLVLMSLGQDMLGVWAQALVDSGPDQVFALARGPYSTSWLILICKGALLLAKSAKTTAELQVLQSLLSPQAATASLGPRGPEVTATVASYLLNRGFYPLIAAALLRQPSKKSPLALPLASLSTAPLSIYPHTSPDFGHALSLFLAHIFTIPQLPNRIPIDALPSFVSSIPISHLHAAPLPTVTTIEGQIHLVANSAMILAPHYDRFPADSMVFYLRLMTSSFNALPPSIFEQTNKKTLSRLEKIPGHLESLMASVKNRQVVQDAFIDYVLALNGVWPEKREQVLSTILALTEGNFIRSLYRFQVRTSGLGRDGNLAGEGWAALLLLTELYTQALVTMGDDEFFAAGSTTGTIRNPLSLDELVGFSRQLLSIAFALYWTQASGEAVSGNPRYTWEVVRDKVTKCLVAVHAREKPFIPPDGWLVTSHIDMRNFVQAAILEEQQLASDDTDAPIVKRIRTGKGSIASLSPCLGVLNNIPFAIPFEVRVSIFRHFVMNDMAQRGVVRDRHSIAAFHSRERVRVRRGKVAQDGFDRLSGDDVDLKAPIEITFIDQFGQEEAGIDGGGVFKEFFTDLCKEVFDTDRGLWLANKKNELYPNPHAYATEAHSLNWYRFIGRILGKAMYEGILVDVAFAGFFLAKWLGKQSFLDDLASLDPDLYKGLIFLKHYKGNFEDLSVNFTIAVDELGVTKNVDLVPDGSNISVTRENRLKYITLVSHYRLSRQIRRQSEAFFEGLSEMIDARWLRMFNQQEVQILIGGVNSPIDLEDLRRYTNYGGLYDDDHPVIVAFWKVVDAFDQEQRRALLRFVTSCSRPPLLGFKELVPNFSIRDAGTDSHRLPTSSTCVNLLKLPLYNNEKIMKRKILQAITSGAGFDLS